MATPKARLEGKVALVTAAGGPMGRAIAARFADEGASLIINDISGSRLQETVAHLGSLGLADRILARRGSVLLEGEVQELVSEALARFGRIDILVNVVGGIYDKVFYRPFLEISDDRWAGTFAINLNATRFLTKLIAPRMIANRYGRIVNIASIDYAGERGHADYSASKAALVALSRVMAIEFAPYVTINCVAPGIINTLAAVGMDPDKLEELKMRNLMKRLGEPDEVAAAVLFLGSADSSFITGEVLSVSGGIRPAL
jgi:3-oxoacyl-[acyl-carrier protein] reductase